MDPRAFCAETRLVIVAGKGGVGKTTVAAALARMAARLGLSTLLVDIEGKEGLASAFGSETLDYEERVVWPAGGPGANAEIRARTLRPDRALVEYLEEHGLRRVSRRLAKTGAVEVVSTSTPGIKDILILGKVKQLEQKGVADLIVLDAPAAGHAVSFLTSAAGLIQTVGSGPILAQAEEVTALLTDPSRSRVLLVTLPEETPVNEVVDTAFALEDRVGVDLGPVVVNRLLPELSGLDLDPVVAARDADVVLADGEAESLRAAAVFRAHRQELQRQQLERLTEALPLPQLHLPAVMSGDLGPAELDLLADALADGVASLQPAQ